jgi:hypothetical protein
LTLREPSEHTLRLARLIRDQALACQQLGSPLYAHLLDRLADDVLAGGPGAAALAGHESARGPDALPLRLMGGVHRLVLEGAAPDLARFYPSIGGEVDHEDAWPALRYVLEAHLDALRAGLDQPPQTNEVGRAGALIGGLLHVVAWSPGPLRLFELGASAGLNLRADHFRVALDGGQGVGPVSSPVVLDDPWRGPMPPLSGALDVVERAGCDVSPLDPTTEEGRLRLTSYVWPDQLARLARLRGAMDLAAQVPVVVYRMPAVEFVRRVQLVPGTTTVLWHSVVWQYLSPDERTDVERAMDDLAAGAGERGRLAHLRLEPQRRMPGAEREFLVRLRTWPGGLDRILGVAHPHGIPTTWE